MGRGEVAEYLEGETEPGPVGQLGLEAAAEPAKVRLASPPLFSAKRPLTRFDSSGSTLDIRTLVVVNGLTAGLAEVSVQGRGSGAAHEIARLTTVASCLPCAQAIDFFGFDDNLSLPVLFGFFCWLSMYGQSADEHSSCRVFPNWSILLGVRRVRVEDRE